MKKNLFFYAAVALALVACNPEKTQDPKEDVDSITLKTNYFVDLGEDQLATVEFTATKDWKVELCGDNASEWASIASGSESGVAGDCKVKLTFTTLPEEVEGRYCFIFITTEKSTATVYFVQGKVFEAVTLSENVDVEGGEVRYYIFTNCEYTAETFNADFPWAPATVEEESIFFTVAANEGPDPRQAYVAVTVPELRDPVISTETWEPIPGETQDRVIYLYANQAGNSNTVFESDLDLSFKAVNKVSLAKFGNSLLVCADGAASLYDAATGAYVSSVPLPQSVVASQITNDDAGNIIVVSPGDSTISVFAVAQADAINVAKYKNIVTYPTNIDYNYGVGNVKVTGDVLGGKGVVTMISAGGLEDEENWIGGPTYVLAFQVEKGDLCTTPTKILVDGMNDILWTPYAAVAKARTNEISGGIYYIAYDGNYDLLYNPTATDGAWQVALETTGEGNEGFNAIDIAEFGGKPYIAFVQMSYFPYWSCPSYTWIANIENPAAAQTYSVADFLGIGASNYEYGVDPQCQTTDILLEVEDGKLVTYVIDGMQLMLRKMTF